MSAIDFANSFMTFTVPGQRNIARIQLDAACVLIDERRGTRDTYYLIAPCRAERMYLDGPLFQLPNYEFCGIWSATDFLLIRTHWVSARDNREVGTHQERFADVRLDITPLAQTWTLADAPAVVAATLANRPLLGRTELWDEASGRRAVLDYPIKTMNVRPDPPAFQVDTGPLIVPDFGATTGRPIECFDLAYVVYQAVDQAEFILRRPRPARDDDPTSVAVTDYSTVQIRPARNSIIQAG